jgi:GT2 family glycosyltransferase
LPPDVAADPTDYSSWVVEREAARCRDARRRSDHSLHLVMLVHEPRSLAVALTLRALARQTSRRWTLDITSTDPDQLATTVRACLPRRLRPHVRLHRTERPENERQLLVESLPEDDGPVALVYPGDVWAPDAVSMLTSRLTPRSVVYADEDRIDEAGSHVLPRFKPDYSPDFLLATNYVGRPLAMGAEVMRALPGRLVADGGPDLEHDVALSACDAASSVVHVPEVLCHRQTDTETESDSGTHVVEALRRRDDAGLVAYDEALHLHTITRSSRAAPVSILIPFKDQPRFLRTCLDSVTATAEHGRIEFVLIDNGSTDLEMLALRDRVAQRPDVKLLVDPSPFNWAKLNNAGAGLATGEVLLFLNDDIEARHQGWLSSLVGHALRSDIGAVGARLMYPGGSLQHCGIVVGLGGAAGHPLAGLGSGQVGYLGMDRTTRECSAVTGACIATRRDVFDELGGFDDSLGVDLNDVDYCLRARKAGYRTIYDASACLVHHESPSRGTAGGTGDIVRFVERWGRYIAEGDPYLNPHLTRADPSCRLATPEEAERWKQWHSTLTTP